MGITDDLIRDNQDFIADYIKQQQAAQAVSAPANGVENQRAKAPPPPPPTTAPRPRKKACRSSNSKSWAGTTTSTTARYSIESLFSCCSTYQWASSSATPSKNAIWPIRCAASITTSLHSTSPSTPIKRQWSSTTTPSDKCSPTSSFTSIKRSSATSIASWKRSSSASSTTTPSRWVWRARRCSAAPSTSSTGALPGSDTGPAGSGLPPSGAGAGLAAGAAAGGMAGALAMALAQRNKKVSGSGRVSAMQEE
ncbi:hypothetical protein M7I_3173 [Glarea lozoyensis 74030]|uniref:Uncharacterized protein n=1 Tax=Glarea lozoyensis (strain ATCC 74030 / MF5533) TaxID=1104152 RepID=H0EKU2_GLAL7|nr:hypothetical protein M7I_3173 [Glarea lozoyensis 74030]